MILVQSYVVLNKKYAFLRNLLQERKKHIERLLGHRGDIVDITDGTTSEEEVDRKVKRGHHKFADHLSGKNIIKKYKLKGFAKQEKERDPNAPKKPANAFFHFCQENRNLYQDAQKEGDSSGHHDLTKFLGSKWNSLETSDKKVAKYLIYLEHIYHYEHL